MSEIYEYAPSLVSDHFSRRARPRPTDLRRARAFACDIGKAGPAASCSQKQREHAGIFVQTVV